MKVGESQFKKWISRRIVFGWLWLNLPLDYLRRLGILFKSVQVKISTSKRAKVNSDFPDVFDAPVYT